MAKRTKRLIEHRETETVETEGVRLNKYLSDAGFCSRREADKLIETGEVLIDGQAAQVGAKVLLGQSVEVKGKSVKRDENLVLIAFNKPRGIVCTTDKREKDNIIDYLKYGKRIYPIGRLDKDSEGLILLTNDGNIVNKILRAGNNHEKEYIVTVNKAITSEFLKGMESGVPILDTVTKPCEIKTLDRFTFQIILTQGMNRQIRRMCEYFDYKVLTLKRIRIMNINLGYLQLGGYRNVTDREIATINELIQDSENMPELPMDKELKKSETGEKYNTKQRKIAGSNDRYKKSSYKDYKYKNKNHAENKGRSFDKEKIYNKDTDSTKDDTFSKDKELNKDKGFSKEKDFGKDKKFNKNNDFDKDKRHSKDRDSNKGKRYSKERDSDKDKRYSKDRNFDKDKSYSKDRNFDKDKSYNKDRGFDKDKRYSKNKDFDKDKRFNIDKDLDKDKSSKNEKSFDNDRYNKDKALGSDNRYNKDKDFNKDKKYTNEKTFDKDKRYSKEKGFDKDKKFNYEKRQLKEDRYNDLSKNRSFGKEKSKDSESDKNSNKSKSFSKNFSQSKSGQDKKYEPRDNRVKKSYGNATNYNKKTTGSRSHK